jgi:hypothetical protein
MGTTTIDITSHVRQLQQNSAGGHANNIPPSSLQKIIASYLSDLRGIKGLTISVGGQAVKAEQLPEFLIRSGLNPQQATCVIFGLYRGIRETGTIPLPKEDNLFHVEPQQISQMAKDEALHKDLSLRYMAMENRPGMGAKSVDPLYAIRSQQTQANLPGRTPPAAINHYGMNNQFAPEITAGSETGETSNDGANIIHQPEELLVAALGGYLPKPEIKAACKVLFPKGVG